MGCPPISEMVGIASSLACIAAAAPSILDASATMLHGCVELSLPQIHHQIHHQGFARPQRGSGAFEESTGPIMTRPCGTLGRYAAASRPVNHQLTTGRIHHTKTLLPLGATLEASLSSPPPRRRDDVPSCFRLLLVTCALSTTACEVTLCRYLDLEFRADTSSRHMSFRYVQDTWSSTTTTSNLNYPVCSRSSTITYCL